jgi:hypothetical protein
MSAGLTPDSISGVRGQLHTVVVGVNMGSTARLLGSYALTLQWDSTIVRVDSVRGGDFGAPLINYVHGGEVRLTQVNTAGLANTFSLARLYVRFVNDTIGRRTLLAPNFTEMTATDFTDLRPMLATIGGVARVLPPSVLVRFTPDSTYERVGFAPQIEITADLGAAPGVALGSYAATMTWDPTIMVFESMAAGDFAAPQINVVSSSELRLTAADGQGRGGAPFSLARLTFRFVSPNFPSVTTLVLTVSEMHAALTFADLLPGVTARSGKAVIGGVLRGDIDVSGSVLALDAQLILQGVVGLALPQGIPGLPHGDADCNGILQARDAQIALNVVVGNSVAPFCGGTIR